MFNHITGVLDKLTPLLKNLIPRRGHSVAADKAANGAAHSALSALTGHQRSSASAYEQQNCRPTKQQTSSAFALVDKHPQDSDIGRNGSVESAFDPALQHTIPSKTNLTEPSKILKPYITANRFAFWIPGFALASWTPLIPYVKDNFALGTEHLGLILMCLATGQGLAVVLSPMLISLLGCRRTVKVIGLCIVLGLLAITLVSNIYLLGALLILYGWMAETVSMSANLNAVNLERYNQRSLLSGMNGILSLGSVCGVMLVTAMLHVDLQLSLPVICTAEILSMLVLLYCSQIASRRLLSKQQLASPNLGIPGLTSKTAAHKSQRHADHASGTNGTNSCNLRQVLKQPVLWGLGLMCLVIYMTEDSVNDWSGLYLIQDYGMPMQEAGLGFLAFASMMALSRLVGDRLVWIWGRQKVIFGGAVITALGFCLATSGISAALSLVGFAMVGLGTANIAPQCISYAASLKSLPQSSIFVVNGVGAVGSLAGPAVIGQITAWSSLHTTFLLIAGAIAGVAALSLLIVKEHSSQKAKQQAYLQQSETTVALPCNFHHKYLSCFKAAPYVNEFQSHIITLREHRIWRNMHFAPSDFILLENPMLFWQNLSLQHWTISVDEPPGKR